MKRQYISVDVLPAWAKLNDVAFRGVQVKQQLVHQGMDKGSAVVAERELQTRDDSLLMIIPKEMILSLDAVVEYGKSDKHLREVLEAMGTFGRTARGAILIFLLMQITNACPDIPERIGISRPWTEYIKFLPSKIPLPTLWGDMEQDMLTGTSLAIALHEKLNSLMSEYEMLKQGTVNIPWCKKYWWDEDTGLLLFDDWKLVDAMYRSRALDLPRTGHAMVPCIDMANHASGDETIALYETDDTGDGILLLRDGKTLHKDDEVTITYGDDKGACEMVFSYGFIESAMQTAKEMFLDLDIPDDDPLKRAKNAIAGAPPGFRVFDSGESVDWEGPFVWLICVNEEDGLQFGILQSTDGERELEATWKGDKLSDSFQLRDMIRQDSRWDIFKLRVIVTLQGRVESQMASINASEEVIQTVQQQAGIDHVACDMALKLRQLEWDLLSKAYLKFEVQKNELLESETVRDYLACSNTEESTRLLEEDFS
ncbi:MAG: hypothetical protein M1834_002205 [Cirrosporium novae-zelandiae]|nr:MAG: hypothetical protein M1834_002205 [Cirrosporium novae-zelandiae]